MPEIVTLHADGSVSRRPSVHYSPALAWEEAAYRARLSGCRVEVGGGEVCEYGHDGALVRMHTVELYRRDRK